MANDGYKDHMTPVPRSFLDSISSDLGEIKPQVKETNEAIIELKTEMRSTKGRVRKLEDHIPCEAVAEVREDSKKLTLQVNSAEGAIAGNISDLGDIKQKDSKRIYWFLGLAILVLGSAFGWYESRATIIANVGHISTEQTKLRESITTLTQAQKNQTVKVQQATKAVQTAASEVKNGKTHYVPVEAWYNSLSPQDKRILERRGIDVPTLYPASSPHK